MVPVRGITLLLDALKITDRYTHEYNSYSASAGGLGERGRCVDAIHQIAVAALQRDGSDYPKGDECDGPN